MVACPGTFRCKSVNFERKRINVYRNVCPVIGRSRTFLSVIVTLHDFVLKIRVFVRGIEKIPYLFVGWAKFRNGPRISAVFAPSASKLVESALSIRITIETVERFEWFHSGTYGVRFMNVACNQSAR